MTIPIGGLSLWLRADLGVTDDGAGTVSSWRDQINGVLYSQSTGGNAPLVTTDSLANSQTVLSFGNSTQRWLDCTSNPFYGSTAAEFCIVFRLRVYNPTDGNQTGAWIFSNTAGSLDHMTWTDGNVYTSWGTNTRRSITPGYSLSSAYRVWHIRSGRDNWEAWFPNGGYAKTLRYWGNSTVSFINGTTTIGRSGSGTYFNGWIAEVVGANRFLSSEERGSLYHYFQTRYTLPLVGATAPVSVSAVRVNVVRATYTTHLLAGSASGTLTSTGDLTNIPAGADQLLAGAASGTLTETGSLTGVFTTAASASGTLTATGTSVKVAGLSGSTTATGTVTGALRLDRAISGSATSSATVTGTLAKVAGFVGTAAGTGTLTGVATGTFGLIGTSTGTLTAAGTLRRTLALVGTSATATLTLTGTASRFRDIAGTLTGTGSETGAIRVTAGMAGTLSGLLTTSGLLYEVLRQRRDPASDVSATGWTYVGAASHFEALADPSTSNYSEAVTPSNALLRVTVEAGAVPADGTVYVIYKHRSS